MPRPSSTNDNTVPGIDSPGRDQREGSGPFQGQYPSRIAIRFSLSLWREKVQKYTQLAEDRVTKVNRDGIAVGALGASVNKKGRGHQAREDFP